MLHLIVVGATGAKCPEPVSDVIQQGLHSRWPEHVHFVETREGAFKTLDRYPRAVLAYAPGVFGDAVVGGKVSPKIKTTEAQLVLTVAEPFVKAPEVEDPTGAERAQQGPLDQWDGTDDPRQHLVGAVAALDVHLALAVDSEAALDVLGTVLNQSVLPEKMTI